METIIRNVGDIDARDREALEHVLGQQLRENQQLVIGIVNLPLNPDASAGLSSGAATASGLPEWCNVFEGLSDQQLDEIDNSILRSPGGRSFE